MISILSKYWHFICINLTWTRCLVSINSVYWMLNSHRAQSPLNQCLIHSKATSILDRIPLIQILKFQTSLLWLTTSLGSKVTTSPGKCLWVSPVWLSASKSNWNSNQELIWLQLNVRNIIVWTNKGVCGIFS